MIKPNKTEFFLSVMIGVSLLGTIISLFFDSWKTSLIMLLIYVGISDVFKSYKMACLEIGNKVFQNLGCMLNLKNEED